MHELSDDDKEDVAASELFNIKEEQKLLNGRDEVEEKPLENRESTTDSDVSDFNASRKKQSNIRKFFKSRHSSSGDEFTVGFTCQFIAFTATVDLAYAQHYVAKDATAVGRRNEKMIEKKALANSM